MKTYTFEAITREQIKDYCQASGDWNKIHWDDVFAKEAGLPSIIAHGMLSMGLAGRALSELGFLPNGPQELTAKFKEKVLPGDILKAELDDRDPKNIQIRMTNQAGVEVLVGSCVRQF